MSTSKYFESPLRSKELLKETIAFIGTHRLAANPINYTVCYEYFRGKHSSLNHKLNQALSEKIRLTDRMMADWFDDYICSSGQEKLGQLQADLLADLIEVTSKLAESTIQAEDHVNRYDEVLRTSEKELSNTNIQASLEAIVKHLLDNTQIVHASMEQMRQQIQESKQEIISLQARVESATEEALSDPLTGLYNRKGLSRAIEQAALSLNESAPRLCLLMLDIDHFKRINDSLGHILGDRVIKIVGEILKNQIKGKDTAARYGGEEFCVLLPETELPDAVKVAETIRDTIEKTQIKRLSDNQEVCRITISIGVARYKPNEPIDALFERADSALYRSKNEGRNRVTCLDG